MSRTTDSAATSPMSGGGTPKQYSMHTPPPMKTLEECPQARPSYPADGGAKRRRSIRRAGQNGRRSSVFFKLPDLASDTTQRLGGNDECSAAKSSATTARNVNINKTTTAAAEADQQRPQQHQHHGLLASKLSKSSSRRRRASIAPSGGSPLRSRTAITSGRKKDISVVVKSVPEENKITVVGAAAAAVAAAAEAEPSLSPRPTEEGTLSSHKSWAWRHASRGELLLSWGDTGPTLAHAAHPSPRDFPARSSPRALSAGHRYTAVWFV